MDANAQLILARDVETELNKVCEECDEPYCEDCLVTAMQCKIWDITEIKAITHEQFRAAAYKAANGIIASDLPVVNATISRLEYFLFGGDTT